MGWTSGFPEIAEIWCANAVECISVINISNVKEIIVLLRGECMHEGINFWHIYRIQ